MANGKQKDFYGYFKENMEALGLDAPISLYRGQAEVASKIATILAAFKTLGREVTIAELVGATTGLEKLLVYGALRASWYAGAVIGSFAVAAGRYAANGTSISDVMMEIRRNGIIPPHWLYMHLARHPEILDKKHSSRFAYVSRAFRQSGTRQ